MHVRLQALHIAFWGPNYKFEACHRLSNLRLIMNAMKQVVEKGEFQDFEADVQVELNHTDQMDGIRYASVHFLPQICIIVCTICSFS
jgi:hypothetical protein